MTFPKLIAAALICGAAVTPSMAQAPQAAGQEGLDALLAMGQPIYESNCSVCHSKVGKGLVGPSFIGNDRIADNARVIRQITRGGEDMPAFGKKLTPEQILAVGTYVRNSWGNAYGVLTAEKPAAE